MSVGESSATSASENKRLRWSAVAIADASVVALATFCVLRDWFLVHGAGGDGVLGRVTTSSGCEFLLSERWNVQPFEPYTVALWMREPSEAWGWCYVGRQEHGWTEFALEYDREREEACLVNDGVLRGRLECASLQFATYDWRGNYRHTVPAPQERRTPDWR